jgi:hypothetical protein
MAMKGSYTLRQAPVTPRGESTVDGTIWKRGASADVAKMRARLASRYCRGENMPRTRFDCHVWITALRCVVSIEVWSDKNRAMRRSQSEDKK